MKVKLAYGVAILVACVTIVYFTMKFFIGMVYPFVWGHETIQIREMNSAREIYAVYTDKGTFFNKDAYV